MILSEAQHRVMRQLLDGSLPACVVKSPVAKALLSRGLAVVAGDRLCATELGRELTSVEIVEKAEAVRATRPTREQLGALALAYHRAIDALDVLFDAGIRDPDNAMGEVFRWSGPLLIELTHLPGSSEIHVNDRLVYRTHGSGLIGVREAARKLGEYRMCRVSCSKR